MVGGPPAPYSFATPVAAFPPFMCGSKRGERPLRSSRGLGAESATTGVANSLGCGGAPHQGRPPRARSYFLRGVVLLSRRRSGSVQMCILVRTWGCVFVGPLGGHGGGGPLGLYFRATPVPRTGFLDVGCVFGSFFRPFLPPLGLRGAQGELTFESKSHHTLVVRVFPTGVADQVETEGAPPTMPSGRGRFSA